MRCCLAIAAFLFTATNVSFAQGPTGAPPVFKMVFKTEPDKGLIQFMGTIFKTETVSEFRKVLKNGIEVVETVNVQRMVPVSVITAHDATKTRFITPDGKQLPIDEVWKRLKANTVIVVSGDGNTPNAAYLRALNAETIVFIPVPMKK